MRNDPVAQVPRSTLRLQFRATLSPLMLGAPTRIVNTFAHTFALTDVLSS